MSDHSIRLTHSIVTVLDGITQKNGHGDLASYLSKDPREGLAFLQHALRAITNGDRGSIKTRGPEGSTNTNDPALVKQLLGTFLTNYDGKTVEVKLQKRLGGYKTLTLEVPPAQ